MNEPITVQHRLDELSRCREVTVATSRYRVTVRTHERHAPPSTGIYVPDVAALAFDEQLADLAGREADLDDLRWCPSVAEGGNHPEVDQLYRDLHARMAAVKTTLAVAAVGFLAVACPDLLEG